MASTSIVDRFWPKVDKSADCWQYTPEMTYVARSGKRTCRICKREYEREYKRARKAAM